MNIKNVLINFCVENFKNMTKKYSLKFWIVFWIFSIVFLVGFYFFLEIKNKGVATVTKNLPFGKEYETISKLMDYFLLDSSEKTFLILFQNNMEIRPGGGFIGSFGILKVKQGKISELQIHDTSNFDGRIPDTVSPPYPMKETLRINSWKLRDSNYSPDFSTNAQKAEEFYYLGQGLEKFDGIIGITTNVLISFLKVTGPIQIPGYPGTYKDEKAIIDLEYQVEKAFEEQGIPRGERKAILNDFAKEIMNKVFAFNSVQKFKLIELISEDLERKDIQLYFKDEKMQKVVEKAGWGGIIDVDWQKDYLAVIDANLGAWKSDYYVKRSFDYLIDLSKEKPEATLKITYNHTAEKKDFMTTNYLTYLRVYLPESAWLINSKNFNNVKFSKDFGKKVMGAIVDVPLGQSKTVEIQYTLSEKLVQNYNLQIQKQAGINNIPLKVSVIEKNGQKKDYDFVINKDIFLFQ